MNIFFHVQNFDRTNIFHDNAVKKFAARRNKSLTNPNVAAKLKLPIAKLMVIF
jgi:hypothetical protein